MIGTILNALAVVAGGAAGLKTSRPLSATTQSRLRIGLGACTVWIGLNTTWSGLSGSFWQFGKQLLLVLLALTLGKLVGQALRLQRGFNRLGQFAKRKFDRAQTASTGHPGDGFVTCTILFCVAPLAVLGTLQEGLLDDFRLLAVKALMDGLATMGFAKCFGWGPLLAALPVLAYQGTLTLLAQWTAPYLHDHALLDSVSATCGLLVFSVALVILELKKIELANYLPGLFVAPLLTWFCR
ncbi:MAG: DUF554 family protein [Verrucomicrobia bacterium]|nr:DUF554 family protein [Verrucomicrobiota bacterium]